MAKAKLRCEDPTNDADALTDFMVTIAADGDEREFKCFYEHGALWIEHLPCGAQWSVNDGGSATGEEFFVFERVTQGNDECEEEHT